MKAIAAAVMAAGLLGNSALAADPPAAAAAKKHTRVAKTKAAPAATAAELEELKRQMQEQIDALKNQLTDRDTQLKQAQDAAAAAQASADRAASAANAQQQAVTDNAAAVNTLQGTVSDLKLNQTSIVTTIQDSQATVKKAIESPDTFHYKGITISPAGSFIEAATVWRQGATGGDINTPFTGIPLAFADAANLSEFYGSGRQSRLAVKAQGTLANMVLTGYYEADWLSAGVTSNNNQSNSYTMRQRQLWADVKMNNGWDFSGGQGWSLATETTQGLTRGTEILPSTIDAQYNAGFVWGRQYSFRVSKDIGNKVFLGVSAENAETLNPAGSNLPTNLLIGSAGVGGGLYNLNANYSFNMTPDFVAKLAVEPGWGHWELFGVGRSFRDRIYPTTGTPYNSSVWAGGIGGGFRGPLANKRVTVGLKGLWGSGVGRYGSSTIADVTLRPDATISPLHGFSALSTLEVAASKRLSLYLNYGGDYIGRDWTLSADGTKQIGYGTPSTDMSGCHVEVAATGSFTPSTPAHCGANNKDVQEFTAGYWYDFYRGPKGRLRQGIQYSRFERDLWSGIGGSGNPGNGADGVDNMFFTSFRYYLPQ
ncbi:MAG TPA: hypothetical protein VL346_11780 [Acidobacteriaceae bacterium]|nr:hypothetical protein [Acidobacteriaceae bacterium]